MWTVLQWIYGSDEERVIGHNDAIQICDMNSMKVEGLSHFGLKVLLVITLGLFRLRRSLLMTSAEILLGCLAEQLLAHQLSKTCCLTIVIVMQFADWPHQIKMLESPDMDELRK
jgi:hypothetical protein